ncbi:MAG: PAS domain S-box protein [Ardenticatenaceae bacterium]|nr:PAS domain S-box protein [Ardenticatenaceae bacterium]
MTNQLLWLWNWLVAPAPAIQQEEQKRQARLLAAILVVLLPLYVIPEAVRGLLNNSFPFHFGVMAVFLSVAYVFSRTRYYQVGSLITLTLFTFLPISTILLLNFRDDALSTAVILITPTLFLGFLLLSWRRSILLLVVNLATILPLPFFVPDISFGDLLFPLGYIFIMLSLALVSNNVRQQYLNQIKAQADQLKRSEMLFRSIVENSHVGVLQVDSQFCFSYVNDEMSQITGYTTEELLGRDFRTVIDEESSRLVSNYYLRRQAGEDVPARYEFNVVRKDGTIRRVEIIASSIPNGSKRRQATTAQLLDITQRKRIENALRDSEALYQSLVNSLPQNIFRKDVNGRYTFANTHYAQILGCSPEHIIGKSDFDFHPPELAQKYQADDRRVMINGQTLELVEEFCFPGSEKSYVQTVKTPIYDTSGHVVGIQGIFWDITEIAKAQNALRESEAKNRALSESTFEALFFTDKGFCVECNQAAVVMFGYGYDELIGMRGIELITDEFQELVNKNALSGHDKPYEALARRKDGSTFPAQLQSKTYEYEGRIVQVTAVHDITERQQAQAALQKAHDELEKRVQERTQELANANIQLKKLDEIKNKFIEDMSHELRTPLANLNLYLDLMEMGTPDKREKYMTILRQSTNRIIRISEDVLAIMRLELFKESIQFQETNLNTLITRGINQQKQLANAAGLALIFNPNPAVPPILADENQLRHCLVNLITNSIQYTKEGEIVVRLIFDAYRQQVCLEVADTGDGIDPDDLPYLFDRFYRGRQVGQSNIPGSGLGLALVKEIAELHGGSIEAANRPDQGSVFHLWLPVSKRSAD